MHQRLIALEEERRERPTERFAGAIAEEALEGCVHIGDRARARARIEHGERKAAGAERSARKRAVRKQARKRRRVFGLLQSLGKRHARVLPRMGEADKSPKLATLVTSQAWKANNRCGADG